MKTWLVSYADASFRTAQRILVESAGRHGIDVTRSWTRETLQQTSFYARHREIFDRRRGSGYWLWKPFIIGETLREMSDGDLLLYADAGIAVVADLAPVLALCRDGREIVLFANPYGEGDGKTCGTWTKRDCFVLMDCDEPRYHDGPMVDASLLIVRRSHRAIAWIGEWLSYACRPDVLTDQATRGPRPDLPRFIEHRHDQSIVSLLAIRDGLELFRHPSQQGSRHTASPLFRNSPYGTLVQHHRGVLGQTDLQVALRRTIPAPRDRVFEAWTRPEVLASWTPPDYVVVRADADVRVGGQYCIELTSTQPGLRHAQLTLRGEYRVVQPPARLVSTAPGTTQLIVSFTDVDAGAMVSLEHGCFGTEAIRERYAVLWQSFLDHLHRRSSG